MLHSLLLALLLPHGTATSAATPAVITSGDDAPEWTEKLNASGVRLACERTPADCVGRAKEAARREGVGKVYLAIPLDPARSADRAAEYSRLSLDERLLYEIGIDDFISAYARLFQEKKTEDPAG